MKIAAIIAEYNPFHNGHAYQLRRIKEDYGYDFVIVVMSGDFTQRGEPAITDKHTRTQMALLGGADLVIELPAYYACASAEYFAAGAVSLLHGLGCVDALFFGSESEDTDIGSPKPPALFLQAADILLKEPALYRQTLAASLKSGCGYAAARVEALTAVLWEESLSEADAAQIPAKESGRTRESYEIAKPSGSPSSVLSMPNNTLGIEYCKALLRINSPIKPFAIRRIGSGYHDVNTTSAYSSAEAVRALLIGRSGQTADLEKETLSMLVPPDTAQILAVLSQNQQLFSQNDFSDLIHYQLLLHATELERYADCTPELANRIRSLMPSLLGMPFTDMIETIKTRAYTYTRISRVLTHLLLDMTGDRLSAFTDQNAPVFLTHARILGFRKAACGTLLSALKRNARIPLITKPSDYHPAGAAAMLYEADLLASHIYQSAAAGKSSQNYRHELTRSPLIL